MDLKAVSVDHINMSVKNLEESVSFYSKLFGFTVRKDQGNMGSKIIGNDHIKLCMYEHPEMSPEGGISHFGFFIENFGDIIKKCKELGVEVLYEGEVPWEKSNSIYIRDPSGYVVELSQKEGGGI